MKEFDELFRVVAYINNKAIMHTGTDPIVRLPGDREYVVGIDQSTSQTGIAILDMHKNLYCVIDVINRGLPNYKYYVSKLRQFLTKQLEPYTIRHLVYESPLSKKPNVYTRKVLTGLAEMIEGLPAECSSLTQDNISDLNPSAWRKHYLAGSEYDGMRVNTEKVKLAAVQESCRRFPFLLDYFKISGKGTDSADALGIALGFLKEAYYDEACTVRRVGSFMKSIPNLGIYKKVFMTNEKMGDVVLREKPDVCASRKMIGMVYNPDMTLEENCRKASSTFRDICVLMVVDAKARSILKWEASEGDPKDNIFVVTYRNNIKQ